MTGPSETLTEAASSRAAFQGHEGEAGFISYAREDEEFVRALHHALGERDHECWVDWRGLRPTAEWMEELKAAIDAARAVIFVISPDSADSGVCREELKHAESVNKRIIPIVRREVDRSKLPEGLAARQWIFFRAGDDFEASVGTLVDALDTAPEWSAQHTRLLVRAREWERNGRDKSFALRGRDLIGAEAWLTAANTRKQPQPTLLHSEYIISSRRVATSSQRVRMGALGIGLIIALGLAGLALAQRNRADHQAELSRSRELAATSLLDTSNPDRSLTLAVRGAETAKTPQAEDALRHAIENSRTRAVLRGSSGGVNAAEFSPDGEQVVTAGNDGIARVWDAQTGTLLHTFDLQEERLTDASFSPDGRTVLLATTNGEQGSVQAWDVSEERRSLYIDARSGPVHSAAYSPDGGRIVTAGQDGTARIWSTATGRLLTRLRAKSCGGLWTASFSPDGNSLVTAGMDGTARTWNVRTGQQTQVLVGEPQCPANRAIQVNSAAYSPSGKEIVTATDRGTAQIWHPRTGRLLGKLTAPANDYMYTARFSSDGRLIVTASVDGAARIWDPSRGPRNRKTGTRQGTLLSTLRASSDDVLSAAFSPDGRRVVYTGTQGFARVATSDKDDSTLTYSGSRSDVLGVEFSPDGRRLVTASADGTARIYDSDRTGTPMTLRGHADWVWSANFSADGGEVITSSEDHTARIWDTRSGSTLQVLKGRRAMTAADFSHGTTRAVTASFGPTATLWNTDTERAIRVMKSNRRDFLESASVSPAGDRIATGGSAGVGKVWNSATGREVLSLRGHSDKIHRIAFDPSGNRLITASEDQTARIWDAHTGATIAVLQGSSGPLYGAALSPDGNYAAAGGVDEAVRVWDAHTGDLLETLNGARGTIWTLAYSPDGERIAAGSADHTTRVFECDLCVPFDDLLRLGEDRVNAILGPEEQRR